jgi:hypothetical protein
MKKEKALAIMRMGFNLAGDYKISNEWLHDFVNDLYKIKRLVSKHHRLCEYSCNGEGYYRGKQYRADQAGYYKSDDVSWFDYILEQIEGKILVIAGKYSINAMFQHDPRGQTVKLSTHSNIWIDLDIL